MNPNKILIILISISFLVLAFALNNRAEYIEETRKTQEIENNISSTSTVREIRTEEKEVSTYTVKKGDTLWEIAEAKYGSGFKYHEIIKKNPGKTFKFANGRDGLIFPDTILDL